MSVLLVTGSRSLADNPDAEAWAHDVISDRVFSLPDGSVVVTGDARGPDTWAQEYAESTLLSLRRAVYRLDGTVRLRGYDGPTTPALWHSDPLNAQRMFGRRWPLERNKRMIADVARAMTERNEPALCLGLIDPASATNGTRHALRLARDRGIECVEMEYRG